MKSKNQSQVKHVAVVLDGNRRYAKRHGWKPWLGHEVGFDKIESLMEWCQDLDIKELTLYCFSTENFNRDKIEIDYLFDLFMKKIDEWLKDARVHTNEIRIKVIGRIEMFPKEMQAKMNEVMDKTKDYDKFCLNLAMAYGGRAEVVDAVKQIVSDVQSGKLSIDDINEEAVRNRMYLNSYPDMLIRPGGEQRLSNFLIWGAAYSELVFIETLWPEFTKKDLIKCIEEYKIRERRFGK